MEFEFIALLAKAFDKETSYWIDLQTSFLSQKNISDYHTIHKIKPLSISKPAKTNKRLTKLARTLKNEFLIPLGITQTDFAHHLGGDHSFGTRLMGSLKNKPIAILDMN